MPIRGSQILHDVNGFVVDRIQTGGPGNLNIPQEKIYELGNYNSVATVYDTPDISFDLESYDVSTEFEQLLCGKVPAVTDSAGNIVSPGYSTSIDHNGLDFINSMPIDVISPYKSKKGQFDIVKGVAVPYLTLERVLYRFGVKQNSTQQFTLKGDSIFYCPGQPYNEAIAYTGSTGPYTKALAGNIYASGSNNIYTLALCAFTADTYDYVRLFYGADADYTDGSSTQFTLTAAGKAKVDALSGSNPTLRAIYSSSTTDARYDPATDPSAAVHQGPSVKPAAVRGRDIVIYIGDGAATPVMTRLTGVQTFEATRSVSLQADEELGNHHYVDQSYDVADVTGTIAVRAATAADLFNKLSTITGISTSRVIGPDVTTPIQVEAVILDPVTGSPLKTIYIPDARFTVPGVQGRANQKLDNSFAFTSDGGNMTVFNGARTVSGY